MLDPSADVLKLFGGEGTKAEKRKRARADIRALAVRFNAMASCERAEGRADTGKLFGEVGALAVVVGLIHFPRIGGAPCGGEWGATYARGGSFTPAKRSAPRTSPQTLYALRSGARSNWDETDASAEREGQALEFLADINDTPLPILPSVARGLMISAAMMMGRYDPATDRTRNMGHFQKQNAQRASERVAKGGKGKREIVTRADKTRRMVFAAARRLDILAALVGKNADPLIAQAIAIVGAILRPK
jgi:hypothetical protein